ncbi:DUF2968 domain-containing protein [Burkholderia alba]|uniref:DUF2968 domain-containing protein n=1 Tax=Burkholderia alba TaxID=2683677 RepID=UPI002B05E096|nr:DUF2968 domain-containing protein [Burkholderia alba]
MSHKLVVGRACIALAAIGGMQGAQAQALDSDKVAAPAISVAPASGVVNLSTANSQPLPATSPQPSPASNDAGTQSTIDDLQRQIQAHELTEMRTTYNGSYGASLLFNIKDGTYFVALFQQKAFWRVVKTTNEVRAEAVYRDFSRQAESLAATELQAAKLESQKAQTDRQIAVVQERASRLQADLNVAREQQAAVANRQKATRNETAALQAQKDALQAQLRQLQQQVRSLQRQADAGLPNTH